MWMSPWVVTEALLTWPLDFLVVRVDCVRRSLHSLVCAVVPFPCCPSCFSISCAGGNVAVVLSCCFDNKQTRGDTLGFPTKKSHRVDKREKDRLTKNSLFVIHTNRTTKFCFHHKNTIDVLQTDTSVVWVTGAM